MRTKYVAADLKLINSKDPLERSTDTAPGERKVLQ